MREAWYPVDPLSATAGRKFFRIQTEEEFLSPAAYNALRHFSSGVTRYEGAWANICLLPLILV